MSFIDWLLTPGIHWLHIITIVCSLVSLYYSIKTIVLLSADRRG